MIEDLKKNDDVERHLEKVKEQKVIDERQIKQNERQRLKKELGHEYVSSDSENEGKSRDSGNRISVENFTEDIITPVSSAVSPKQSYDFPDNKNKGHKNTTKSKMTESKNQKASQVTAKEEDSNKRSETSYFPLRKLAEYLEKNSKKLSGKNS